MSEKQKNEKKDPRIPEKGDPESWSEDQKKRSYYYDDACGYEIYQPEDSEEEEKDKNES